MPFKLAEVLPFTSTFWFRRSFLLQVDTHDALSGQGTGGHQYIITCLFVQGQPMV
jgi:hypothetical protein